MKRLRMGCVMAGMALAMMWAWGDCHAQPVETAPLRVLLIEEAGYQADEVKELRELFTTLTGVSVQVDAVAYDGYREHVAASEGRYDVCALDQIWLADFVEQGLLAPVDDLITPAMRKDLAPGLKEAFQYHNRAWAVPFLVNLHMLWYHEGLLREAGYSKPPTSLEMLAEYLRVLKERKIVEYPWTDAWEASESLVLEFIWLLGAFDGVLFTEDGEPAFDSEAGQQALDFMKMLLDEELAPPILLHQDELAATDDFLAGRAALTSNWLFLQGLLRNAAPRSAIGAQGQMALLPASESASVKTSSVAAVQGMAILAASPSHDAAWQWIRFFTSQLTQRAFLHEMPVWTSVQTSADAVLLDSQILLKRNQLLTAALRPNLANYDDISAILQTALHQALTGEVEPAAALSEAKEAVLAVMQP